MRKINKDKGVHLYVEAIKQIFQEHKNWRFSVIGTPMKRTNKEYLKFFNNIKNTIKLMFDQGNLEMSLSHEDVQKRMQEAAIVVIPSIWNEPYGLVTDPKPSEFEVAHSCCPENNLRVELRTQSHSNLE